MKLTVKKKLRLYYLKRAVNTVLLLLILQLAAAAQEKGMQFEHGSSWKSIVKKAKAENKYIFVDCYTTWCGPCKFMSANVFPKPEVGDFFNANFINAKFQLDTTSKDAEEIKKLYADAAFIGSTYNVRAYPTYLFFSPNGELVHRELGSSDIPTFIAKGKNALDPAKQYYTQVNKYNSGNREQTFLKNLAQMAIDAYDLANAPLYVKDFLATNPDMNDSSNIRFIWETTTSAKDSGFKMMLNNTERFDQVIGKEKLHQGLKKIILRQESTNNNGAYFKWNDQDWNRYREELNSRHPGFADDVILAFKINKYRSDKDWSAYASTIDDYLAYHSIPINDLNELAWTVFTKCTDKPVLTAALNWSRKSFENEHPMEPGFIDTYANLLYKLGQKEDALNWEKKAQALAIDQGEDKSWGQDVIDKIEKNEPTW